MSNGNQELRFRRRLAGARTTEVPRRDLRRGKLRFEPVCVVPERAPSERVMKGPLRGLVLSAEAAECGGVSGVTSVLRTRSRHAPSAAQVMGSGRCWVNQS